MRQRSGITLIEVLVAIFIMAIGLLALLTLFPLGALSMAQALKDDRCATAASDGANVCDAFGVRGDLTLAAWFGVLPPNADPAVFTAPNATGPWNPVYIDAYGYAMNGSAPGTVGASAATTPPTPGIVRTIPAATVMPQVFADPRTTLQARYFTLLDDMTFMPTGLADTTGTNTIQRGDRYTWAYMLHQTSAGHVDLVVVVYAGRLTTVAGGENTYAAAGAMNDTVVTMTYAGAPPAIRRGSWILDTSYEPNAHYVHGDFYRVVSVSPSTTVVNTLNLELQTPLSKNVSAATVLDNVVEVFERGSN